MDTATQVQHLATLYREPDAEDLRQRLPDLADGIHTQLLALHAAPSESGCDDIARTLHGLRNHVLRLAAAIKREQ